MGVCGGSNVEVADGDVADGARLVAVEVYGVGGGGARVDVADAEVGVACGMVAAAVTEVISLET